MKRTVEIATGAEFRLELVEYDETETTMQATFEAQSNATVDTTTLAMRLKEANDIKEARVTLVGRMLVVKAVKALKKTYSRTQVLQLFAIAGLMITSVVLMREAVCTMQDVIPKGAIEHLICSIIYRK